MNTLQVLGALGVIGIIWTYTAGAYLRLLKPTSEPCEGPKRAGFFLRSCGSYDHIEGSYLCRPCKERQSKKIASRWWPLHALAVGVIYLLGIVEKVCGILYRAGAGKHYQLPETNNESA